MNGGVALLIQLKNQEITKIGIESTIDFYRTIAIDQLHLSGLDVFATGSDTSPLNVVLDTRTSDEMNLQTVNQIAAFFKKHNVPWEWSITALSKTTNIEEYGFKLLCEAPSMYFDLSEELQRGVSDIEIIEVHDDLREWIKPLQQAFPSNDNCENYRKLNADLLQKGEKKLRHFTAYRDNEAISSGTLFLSTKSVMLHNLATKNEYRKRGVGSSLTTYMMNEAKKAGYKHCYLESSDEGFNLYSKLGFKVYSIPSIYVKDNI